MSKVWISISSVADETCVFRGLADFLVFLDLGTSEVEFEGASPGDKSENDCMRVMKKALQMEALDSFYVCSKPDEESIKVPKRGTKRARPVDDMDIVSSVGAQNLENLFRAKRAKLSLESKKSKFRLLDVEKKTNDKVSENCVYDIFYVRDPSVADASLDVINFFIHSEDICDQESENEESKEEIKLEMNYFDDAPLGACPPLLDGPDCRECAKYVCKSCYCDSKE